MHLSNKYIVGNQSFELRSRDSLRFSDPSGTRNNSDLSNASYSTAQPHWTHSPCSSSRFSLEGSSLPGGLPDTENNYNQSNIPFSAALPHGTPPRQGSSESLLGNFLRSDQNPNAEIISDRSSVRFDNSTRIDRPLPASVNIAIGVEAPEHSPNTVALREKLDRFFEPCKQHITPQNREALEQLIDQRAVRLNEMGETPESIDATMAKGQKLDRCTQPLVGFVRSIPYGGAAGIIGGVHSEPPTGDTALTSFSHGAYGGAADKIMGGTGLLKNATSDTLWLTANPKELEPVIADATKAREPSLTRRAVESAATVQTFSLLNATQTALVPAKAKMAEKTVKTMSASFSAVGTALMGALSASIQHRINENKHRTGPEYLFGHQEWEAKYTALKNYTAREAMGNFGKRAAQLPVDIATNSLKSIRDFGTAGSLVKNLGGLGGGYALTTIASENIRRLAKKQGLDKVSTELLRGSADTVGGAVSFAAWGAAGVVVDPLAEKASRSIRDNAANLLHARPPGSQPLPTEPRDDIDLEASLSRPDLAATAPETERVSISSGSTEEAANVHQEATSLLRNQDANQLHRRPLPTQKNVLELMMEEGRLPPLHNAQRNP